MSNLDSKFSIEEIITSSWANFNNQFIFWIGITLFSLIVSSVSNMSVLVTPISMYFSASIALMYVNYMRNLKVSINDLISVNASTFIHYVFVNICCGVAVIMGLICFIVPGIYLATRLIFAQYLVIDQHKSFDEAIKMSWKITKGEEFNLFLFIIAMCLLIIVGACVFLVGLLVAMPIAGLCTASLYLIFFRSEINSIEEVSLDDLDFE